jgi:hypothetical protein
MTSFTVVEDDPAYDAIDCLGIVKIWKSRIVAVFTSVVESCGAVVVAVSEYRMEKADAVPGMSARNSIKAVDFFMLLSRACRNFEVSHASIGRKFSAGSVSRD